MTDSFEFTHGGVTFACAVEASRATRSEPWWWFSVSSERLGERYAPFRADESDTRDSVQARVSACYEDMVTRRSLPPTPHNGRS